MESTSELRAGGDENDSELILYRRRWIVLAVFSLIAMSNLMIWDSLSAIASITQTYYNVNPVLIDMLSMVYLIALLFVTLSSYFLDRFGLKVTIVTGAVLNGLGSCFRLFGLGRKGFVYVFMGSTFAAIAQTLLFFIPPRLASVWFGEHERATASSVGMVLSFAGAAVGFLTAVSFVPSSADMDNQVRSGMQNLLAFQAVLCCALAVVSFICIKDAPPTPPSRSQQLLQNCDNGFRENASEDETREQNIVLQSTSSSDEPLLPKEQAGTNSNLSNTAPKFKDSLIILAKSKHFHVILQAYGLYFGVMNSFSPLLNQILISKYEGKEKEIGYMGFASLVCGIVAMLIAGIILDKMKCYKVVSVICFVFSAIFMVSLSIAIKYTTGFHALFFIVCMIGLFSLPFVNAGLEYAAEVTYPVSEGTTSALMLFLGSAYGIGFFFVIRALIKSGHHYLTGYIFALTYLLGLLLIISIHPPLKRSGADQN